MKHTVLKIFFEIKMKYLHTFPKNALIPELRASGSFFSWSTESVGLVVTRFVVVAAAAVVVVGGGEVVGTVLVVDIIVVAVLLAVVIITGFVLPRVVFSEVWLSEEDVVRVSFTKPDVTVVEALVVLLAALVSSVVAGEVALYSEVVFAVVWSDVELFVVLVLTCCGDSVVVSSVLWVVETDSVVDCVSVESADVVCVSEGDVATSEVNVVATVVAVDAVLSVLPPNIIQPVTRTKTSHKKSILTRALYIDRLVNAFLN